MVLAFVLSFVVQAAPGPVGVFKSPERIIQVALVGEGQFRVRRWGQRKEGFPTRFVRPKTLELSFGDQLEFSDDFSRFTVRSPSRIFGELRSTQAFARLSPTELELLMKDTASAEDEARSLLERLHEAELRYFELNEKFSDDPVALDFEAEACVDGSRPDAGPGRIPGCKFELVIEVHPKDYVAVAFGVGAEVRGLVLSISSAKRFQAPAGVIRLEKTLLQE